MGPSRSSRAIREDTPPALTEGDLVATLARRIAGSPPAFASLRPDERLQVAVHEVGHGLVALANGVDVWLVSVEPGASVGRAVTGDLGLLPSADRLLTQLSIGLEGWSPSRSRSARAGSGRARTR